MLVEGLHRHPRFSGSTGSRGFVLGVPFPALFEAYGPSQTCGPLRDAFLLAVEKTAFCPDDQVRPAWGSTLPRCVFRWRAGVDGGRLLPLLPGLVCKRCSC